MWSDPVLEWVVRLGRFLLAGPGQRFRFHPPRVFVPPPLEQTGVYVHIPFCNSLCPYCPYNRVPWDPALADRYLAAVLDEICWYGEHLPGLEITSVYFGGGTPTIMPEGMAVIAEALRNTFRVTGPFCTETHPADLSRQKARLLRSCGFTSISLGVESFAPRLLALIGRNYGVTELSRAIDILGEEGFPSVNLDLMFAIPGQTLAELDADIATAVASPATQITAYPLFSFPYSPIGNYRRLKRVGMPPLSLRRQMYYRLYDSLAERGFSRVSVWSFHRKSESIRYSSVTRERYLGFGAGAGTFFGPLFTLNTFSVTAYAEAVARRGHAVALEMPFPRDLQVLYDFYWRLYDTYIPEARSVGTMEYRISEEGKLAAILAAARWLGMAEWRENEHALTRRGSFWMHLAQNYLSLKAVNSIWAAAKAVPWPSMVQF